MEPDPSLWKMLVGMYGQADAEAPRKSPGDAIKSSSDPFRHDADPSHVAGTRSGMYSGGHAFPPDPPLRPAGETRMAARQPQLCSEAP